MHVLPSIISYCMFLDADFVCIRDNKGLCGICMRTIMMIENSAQGNNEKVC